MKDNKISKPLTDIRYLGKGVFECRHVKEDTIAEDCSVCNLHAADAQIKYLKSKMKPLTDEQIEKILSDFAQKIREEYDEWLTVKGHKPSDKKLIDDCKSALKERNI